MSVKANKLLHEVVVKLEQDNTLNRSVIAKPYKMKKFKKSLIALAICAVAITGYNIYEKATMTDEEKFLQANIEALTGNEVDFWLMVRTG